MLSRRARIETVAVAPAPARLLDEPLLAGQPSQLLLEPLEALPKDGERGRLAVGPHELGDVLPGHGLVDAQDEQGRTAWSRDSRSFMSLSARPPGA